uniref:Uncharacterized protein n=1 Tax=Eptatretus burgeri TaxID=7764 RepID=A0A8C4R3Q8_EPTBU
MVNLLCHTASVGIPSPAMSFMNIIHCLSKGLDICGALSWLLITGTGIPQEARLGQGWVMFVTVTTFILAAILFLLYLFSIPKDTFAWVVLVCKLWRMICAFEYSFIACMHHGMESTSILELCRKEAAPFFHEKVNLTPV